SAAVTAAGLPPVTGGGQAASGPTGAPGAGSAPPDTGAPPANTGAPRASMVSQAPVPSGLSGPGTGMSAATGGSAPGWPGLPDGNSGPWAVNGPATGQSAASGSGHGGAGPVAVLAAAPLITVLVLRNRRANPVWPRSAWLSAFEVPG